jgi:hypothetical protein
MATSAAVVTAPARPGWWRTLLAVIAGTIVAGACWLVAFLALSAVHLLPATSRDLPGHGWPWRIDGAWAFAADLGPLLCVGFAFAAATSMYLERWTGVRAQRWPLALVAATVGWFAGVRHGVVVISGSAALVAVVIAAHHWSTIPRRSIAWSRARRCGLAVAVLGLGTTSLAYGALHPLVAAGGGDAAVVLTHGRSPMVIVDLADGGPLDVHMLAVSIGGGARADPAFGNVRLAAVEVPNGARSAPTIAGLFAALGAQMLAPGQHIQLFLTFAARCPDRPPSPQWLVSRLAVRLRVAGSERTQSVGLAPPLAVRCGFRRGRTTH